MKRPISSVLTALLLLTAQTILAQLLTGNKTIGGTSPDYTTISAAIAALNANGTAAPGVTFLIRSGTYTETATLNITTTTGASNAPIVFKPDVGATVTVNVLGGTGAAWNLAAGVDFVTIDGSNSGGTSRDMTIRNTTAGANVGIRGAGTNPDCQIKNVIVETGAASSANRNSVACRGIDIFLQPPVNPIIF
jgi:hypothetical protein